IRDGHVTGVQTCALPICLPPFGFMLALKLAVTYREFETEKKVSLNFVGESSNDRMPASLGLANCQYLTTGLVLLEERGPSSVVRWANPQPRTGAAPAEGETGAS